MDDLISKLSEIRSEYNCFDENEEPYYRALSEAIKFLSRRADGDTVSKKLAIDALEKWESESVWDDWLYEHRNEPGCEPPSLIVKQLPSAEPEMVKCKQCRHVYYDKEFDNYWCDRMSDPFKVEADGYCKWGKRHGQK